MTETDLISRQDAIDALDKRFDDVPMELTVEILQLRRDLRERIPSAQPDISDDGTLMMTVPHGMLGDVKRVMVDEVGTKNCKVMYQDEPERKKGEWIETEFLKLRECSCCHVRWGMYDVENFNFCPNCGADMKGEENETD